MTTAELKEFQVVVRIPIWLSGRIVPTGVYDNPPDDLVQAALENNDKQDASLYFAKEKIRVNPLVEVADIPNIPDKKDEIPAGDLIGGEGEEDGDSDEGSDDENEDDADDNPDPEIDSMFVPDDEFAVLAKEKQFEYIQSIRNAPEDFDEDRRLLYEQKLFVKLNEYNKVVSGKKAKELITEVLAEYDEN